MGLDMFVFRVTELSEEEQREVEKMTYGELCDSDYDRVDADENESLVKQIKPYLFFVKKPVDRIHFDLLKKVCGIPEDARWCWSASGTFGFRRENDDKAYEVNYNELTPEQKKQVTPTDTITYAIYKREDLLYWRKAYDLRDKIREACDVEVENCGSYPLNDKMREVIKAALKEEGREDIPDLTSTDDSVVCYHEWY